MVVANLPTTKYFISVVNTHFLVQLRNAAKSRVKGYILFSLICDLLLELTGVSLIVSGMNIYSHFSIFEKIIGNRFLLGSSLLIISGCLLIFVTILSFIGALKQNFCILIITIAIEFIIFLMLVVAGTSAILFRGKVALYTETNLQNSMELYSRDREVQFQWDKLQVQFHCCGVFSTKRTDWAKIFNITNTVPFSCCDNLNEVSEYCYLNTTAHVYNEGCFGSVIPQIVYDLNLVTDIGMGIACVVMISIFVSSCLTSVLRREDMTMYSLND